MYTPTFVAEGDLRLPEPLSTEAAALRTVLYASLLEPAGRNADAGAADVALFEVARVYRDTGEALPEEHWHVAGIAQGGLAEAKWAVEQVYAALGVEPSFERATEPFLHPGKSARTAEGWLGELHPALLDGTWGVFELDLDALAAAAPQAVAFEEVSPYPEVRQDLAFVVDEDVPAAELVAAIRGGGRSRAARGGGLRRVPRRADRRGQAVARVPRRVRVARADADRRGRRAAAGRDRRGARRAVRRRPARLAIGRRALGR